MREIFKLLKITSTYFYQLQEKKKKPIFRLQKEIFENSNNYKFYTKVHTYKQNVLSTQW